MFLTKALMLLMILRGMSFAVEKICDETVGEILHWNENDLTQLNRVKKQIIVFLREQSQPTIKVTEIKLTHNAIYCPAIMAAIASPNCLKFSENILLTEDNVLKSTQSQSCPRGDYCNDGKCDGLSQDDCFHRPLIGTMPGNSKENVPLSGSLFHHQCGETWECELNLRDIKVLMMPKDEVQVMGSMISSCNMSQHDRMCITEKHSTIYLHDPIAIESSTVKLPCLIGSKERLCFDEKSGESIFVDADGYSYNENVRYRAVGESPHDLDNGFVFKNEPANLLDVQRIYHTLQFENLQTLYDVYALAREAAVVKSLLTSIAMYSMGITPDPLYRFRQGKESSAIQGNLTHTQISPCRSGNYSKLTSGPLSFAKGKPQDMFPYNNLSMYEYKRMEFHLDTLGIDDVLKLIEIEGNRDRSGKAFNMGFDFKASILDPIANFFNSLVTWVAWISLLLNIYVIRLLIVRRAQV